MWDTNYTGSHNPLSYNGEENYSLKPTNAPDIGSFYHDKRYDHYKAVGAHAVMTDFNTIGTDYKFIAFELFIASPMSVHVTPKEKLEGLGNGLYMFIATLPKTIIYGLSILYQELYLNSWIDSAEFQVLSVPNIALNRLPDSVKAYLYIFNSDSKLTLEI